MFKYLTLVLFMLLFASSTVHAADCNYWYIDGPPWPEDTGVSYKLQRPAAFGLQTMRCSYVPLEIVVRDNAKPIVLALPFAGVMSVLMLVGGALSTAIGVIPGAIGLGAEALSDREEKNLWDNDFDVETLESNIPGAEKAI